MNTNSGNTKDDSVSTKIFTPKMTEEQIEELAKKLCLKHFYHICGVDAVKNTITEWQTPEKDILEGKFHQGQGHQDMQVFKPGGGMVYDCRENSCLTDKQNRRLARTAAQIPQMVKYLKDMREEGPSPSMWVSRSREILDAIDNITPVKE